MGPGGPRMMGGMGPGGRMPGPPPPYPQSGPGGPMGPRSGGPMGPGGPSPNYPNSPSVSLPMSSPAGGGPGNPAMINSPRGHPGGGMTGMKRLLSESYLGPLFIFR